MCFWVGIGLQLYKGEKQLAFSRLYFQYLCYTLLTNLKKTKQLSAVEVAGFCMTLKHDWKPLTIISMEEDIINVSLSVIYVYNLAITVIKV